MGQLNGAQFRIDVPEHWNGGLVVYCHGYSAQPVTYKDDKLPPLFAVFTDQGYALAQSGYAAGGWAVQEAVTDTETLRRYFISKYGKPKETYITGHSMGGFLTMMLMERYPTNYDAGLALCGPLAPANYFMNRGVFRCPCRLRLLFSQSPSPTRPRTCRLPGHPGEHPAHCRSAR